eukprot:7467-Prymnesium_polylepis.1
MPAGQETWPELLRAGLLAGGGGGGGAVRWPRPMFAINSLLDSLITQRLKKYLAMGTKDGKRYSDVVVQDGSFDIEQLLGQLDMIDDALRDQGIPARCVVCHCKNVRVRLPWFNFSQGFVEITVDEPTLVLRPVGLEGMTVDEVRRTKETLILRAVAAFLKRQRQAVKQATKLGFLERLRAQVLEAFRPRVAVQNLHVRFEQPPSETARAFALGWIVREFTMMREEEREPTTRRQPRGVNHGETAATASQRVAVQVKDVGVYCVPLRGAHSTVNVGQRAELPQTEHHRASQELTSAEIIATKRFFEQQEAM